MAAVKSDATPAMQLKTALKGQREALVEMARAAQLYDNVALSMGRNASSTLTDEQKAAMKELRNQHYNKMMTARANFQTTSAKVSEVVDNAVSKDTAVRVPGDKSKPALTDKQRRAKYASLLMKTTYGGRARAADYTALVQMRDSDNISFPSTMPKRVCHRVPTKGRCPSGSRPYLTSSSSVCCRKPRRKSGKGKRRSSPRQKYCLTV